MKSNIFTILIILTLPLLSCQSLRKNNSSILVKEFYEGMNTGNYSKIKELIGDRILIKEGDYVTHYCKEEYYTLFRWDSVFNPEYKLIETVKKGKNVEVKISQTCDRIQFLNQNPIISKAMIKFNSGKIKMIDIIEQDSDFKLWNIKKEKVIQWIKKNHSELDGFIHDQTIEGAQKYKKVIDLYPKK